MAAERVAGAGSEPACRRCGSRRIVRAFDPRGRRLRRICLDCGHMWITRARAALAALKALESSR
jgi:hypothetical protein